MPFRHGSKSAVYLGSVDLSAYLTASDFSIAVDSGDTTTFTSTWKSYIVGQDAAKQAFQGYYDPALTQLDQTLLGVDPAAVLSVVPGGPVAIGDQARLMTVMESSFAESSPVGGVVGIKWNATPSGTVGLGQVLHPLAADVNTTTGAEKDDAAATTTGWTASLHVTAVTAGSWVVKLQDAAVSNTYTDLASGAFTAATTATSQRLSSAAGATLRRYVRYVATRTGGAGGDSITFFLAYARNV